MANRSTGLMSKQNGSTREDRSRHDEFGAFDVRSVRAGRIRLALVGLSLSAVALNWLVPGFQAVSPGLACCAMLLWLTNGIVDERDFRATPIQTGRGHTSAFNAWRWGVGVPLLFVVWSCVDDTFWIGWFLLSAAAVGRGLDWRRDSRRRTSLARDRSFVRWLSLLALALAATLLGPNGLPWIEQARGDFVLAGRWLRTGAANTVASWRMLPASEPTLAASATTVIAAPILSEVFDQAARAESAAFVVLTDNVGEAAWWRPALQALVAAGGVWWLTLQAVKQSGRCFTSAEQGVLLLSTVLFWWKPELGEWFVLAWAIVLAPHLANLVERENAVHETVLGESGGSITTGNMSEQGLSDFALADAAGGWMRMLRCSVARLSHIVRRLARDEEALMLDVGRTRTASTILIPVFAIMVLAAGTWFVRHAGAGSVCEVECVPRVRPVGVSPLFDEKSVVSDAQLSRVFSSPSLAAAFRSGDSSSSVSVESVRDGSERDQLDRFEYSRERDLARCLAIAGWRGLTADTVLQTADGGRSISTLLRQLRREFRLRTPALEQHPCAESLLAFAFYMPDTRHWLDAEGLPVTFDMLVARVLKQESWCDAIDERETTLGRDALAELDRLWSLAVVLRIDDQQSLLSERTRSLIVDRLRLATRQWCETQRNDGSWDEHGHGEAASRTAVPSEAEARLFITAHTLTWWGLCPREVLPPFEVRVRAARWLCDQFEGAAPASNLRGIVPRLDVIHHRSVAVPTAVASARQAALSDAAQALALWRGRTTAVAFREEQLHRHSSRSAGGPADRVAVEPGRLNQPNLE